MARRGADGPRAPCGTTEATLYLEPGEHVAERYVKIADGGFRAIEGMVGKSPVDRGCPDHLPGGEDPDRSALC
jgi:hypothetical protein